MNEILQQIPVKKSEQSSVKQTQQELKKLERFESKINQENLDPNKRYLACRVVHIKAMTDFITQQRDDEYVFVTISFLKQRFQT